LLSSAVNCTRPYAINCTMRVLSSGIVCRRCKIVMKKWCNLSIKMTDHTWCRVVKSNAVLYERHGGPCTRVPLEHSQRRKQMIWFDTNRLPPGQWPFMNAVRNGLAQIESELEPDIDLTEGNEGILITGCMRAYRQAVMRRVLDLAQSVIAAWNGGFSIGAVVSARSLLESVATFHSFVTRAEAAAAAKQWTNIGELVDAYSFMTSSGPAKSKTTEFSPPRIGKTVREFIAATEPGKEEFWDQLCDTAHPNGKRMMDYAGTLSISHFIARAASETEPLLFSAIFNALYSCCWLIQAELDFNILLSVIRNGDDLPAADALMVQRRQQDELAKILTKKLGPTMQVGPARTVTLMPADSHAPKKDSSDG
jgi:hypothetical protein